MANSQKKKSKYINVFSNEGRERMTVRLPGRNSCECQASKHKLVGNCLKCGRIVCEQEGSGPCLFCRNLVRGKNVDFYSNVKVLFRFVLVRKDKRLYPVQKKGKN
jgi:hypothetical protein